VSSIRFSRLFNAAFARGLLAGVLALQTLLVAIPIRTASASPQCAMACCISKGMHETGNGTEASCSSHVVVSRPTIDSSDTPDNKVHDQSTGDHEMQAMTMPAASDSSSEQLQINEFDYTTDQKSSNDLTTAPGIQSGAFSRPCPPDCGVGVARFSTPTRPRDASAGAFAGRPRPPTLVRSFSNISVRVSTLETLKGRLQPRAPPRSFSCFLDQT
jgi:hypothetical protein